MKVTIEVPDEKYDDDYNPVELVSHALSVGQDHCDHNGTASAMQDLFEHSDIHSDSDDFRRPSDGNTRSDF
jgi:hypothetical protein